MTSNNCMAMIRFYILLMDYGRQVDYWKKWRKKSAYPLQYEKRHDPGLCMKYYLKCWAETFYLPCFPYLVLPCLCNSLWEEGLENVAEFPLVPASWWSLAPDRTSSSSQPVTFHHKLNGEMWRETHKHPWCLHGFHTLRLEDMLFCNRS